MPTPRRTQKQISLRYAGNLLYNRVYSPLRKSKALLMFGLFVVGTAVAAFYLYAGRTSPELEWINSSGGISQSHAGFARDCKQCHDPAATAPLIKPAAAVISIDRSCQRCHVQHTFHQADVVIDHSCTACHHEHLGTGPIQPVKDINCQTCHSSATVMAESSEKGMHLPAKAFQIIPKDNLVYFQPPRPAAGYTQVIHTFDTDHPAFQIQRDNLSDPNTLKFNHEKHFGPTIPEVNGKKLDCTYCHKLDAAGSYRLSLNFDRSCQACHALQIDPAVPNFQIPHPKSDSNTVRNFLLTLPTQYQLYASQHMEELHLTTPAQVDAFVQKHMDGIRQRTRQGDDLVKDVFFSDSRVVKMDGLGPTQRALFPGCAYCHEVKTGAFDVPTITKPITPDRWYVRAKFDHTAHSAVSCEACHGQVLHSSKTSDINLPDKASCVTCHSAKGGVVSTCVTCHGYHNPDPTNMAAVPPPTLKQMMLAPH